MRLRNVKNKEKIMAESKCLIKNPEDYRGNWKKYFGNNNPIHIEIGMGKGNFIIENAIKNPDINFIGIEKYDSVMAKALPKIPVDIKIPNLCMIRLDALNIETIFNKEIDVIYLNFSDPWPKNRHEERRLTSTSFLKKYDNLFKKDATIIQKTDNRLLFEFSLIELSKYGYIFEKLSLDYHNSGEENIIMTEYEKKFSSQGQNIYYLYAVKPMSNK